MSLNSKLISQETMQVFKHHYARKKELEHKELNLMPVLSEDKLTFSYTTRYAIKAKDTEKQRFCSNVVASK